MALITGLTGDATIPSGEAGTEVALFRWSADVAQEIFDGTTFDDTGGSRRKIGGAHDLKGTAEGYCGDTTIPTLGKLITSGTTGTADFVLTSSTGDTYTFTGIVSNVNTVVEKVGGPVLVTMTFESSGPIVVAPA